MFKCFSYFFFLMFKADLVVLFLHFMPGGSSPVTRYHRQESGFVFSTPCNRYLFTQIRSPLSCSVLLQDTQLFSTSCLEASVLSLTINFINGITSDCKQNYLQQNASVHSFKPIYCIDSNYFNYLIKYCIASNQMPHGHLRALYQHRCIY